MFRFCFLARGAFVTLTLALVSCAGFDGASDDTSQPLEPGGSSCAPVSECANVLVNGGYYVAGSGRCALIDYDCPLGERIFGNACGCGCVPTGCPNPADPEREGYTSWSSESCETRAFTCEQGDVKVCGECGSGCRKAACPDPRRKEVRYVSQDFDVCMQRMFVCKAGEISVPSQCGCGCMKRPGLTPDACEASGGRVVSDIGDGAVHRQDYRCASGAPPSGAIVTLDGLPMGDEGAVCCPD